MTLHDEQIEKRLKEKDSLIKRFDRFLENKSDGMFALKTNEYGLANEGVARVKYKDEIDLLYYSGYRTINVLNGELEVLGIFDNKTNSFYPTSRYMILLNVEKSKYYKCSVSTLLDNLVDESSKTLEKYIEENKNSLMNKMRDIFNDRLKNEKDSYESYKDRIVGLAEKNFIYEEEPSNVAPLVKTFASWIRADNNLTSIIILYLVDSDSTIKMLMEKHLSEQRGFIDRDWTNEEYIGYYLVSKEWEREYIEELKKETPVKLAKAHDIVSAIKDIDAVNVTVTLKENEKEITFKYNKELLADVPMRDSDLNHWNVSAKERDSFENFDTTGKSYFDCISEIKYGRKVLYKDESKQTSN